MDENGNNGCGHRDLIDWELLARCQCGPFRVSILEVLALDGGRTLSPTDLTHELGADISNVNYHVRELQKFGLIDVVDERAVRGATEHFYALVQ